MKIKGMLFILFAVYVGHIGAVPQGTEVPSLKQLATIAAAKKLVPLLNSAQSPQQAINTYRTKKTSDFFKLPIDLQQPLLTEIGRQYYILHNKALETGVPWGFSIQDYLTIPALKSKMPNIKTRLVTELNLTDMKINDLKGLQNITNIDTVQSLDLDHNQLTTLQQNAFAGLTNLEYLDLQNNPLTTIQPDAFAGLTNLKDLSLRNNQLRTIKPNAFAGLTNLGFLFLNNNQLTTIQPNAFAGLPNLRFRYLKNNQLSTTIPPDAFAGLNNNLQSLNLGNNQLNTQAQKAIRKALPKVRINFWIVSIKKNKEIRN